jgi:hypothetical protein
VSVGGSHCEAPVCTLTQYIAPVAACPTHSGMIVNFTAAAGSGARSRVSQGCVRPLRRLLCTDTGGRGGVCGAQDECRCFQPAAPSAATCDAASAADAGESSSSCVWLSARAACPTTVCPAAGEWVAVQITTAHGHPIVLAPWH